MMRATVVVLVFAAACSSSSTHARDDAAPAADAPELDAPPDADVAPAFRNPVASDDGLLVLQSLDMIGALPRSTTPRCSGCHGMTRENIAYWRAITSASATSCLTDLAVSSAASARHMIDCLRQDPSDESSAFLPSKLGIYATAASLPWFAYTFDKAYGADGPTKLAAFQAAVQMPRTGALLTQDDFDILAEWFARGTPLLDQTLPASQPPASCVPMITPSVAVHATAMRTAGWRALNRDAGLAMYGCGSALTPLDCLTSLPHGSDQPYGAGWDVPGAGRLRILYTSATQSTYWSRSSPDGRFIARGSGIILDLQRQLAVPTGGGIDPGFFPDNSGFIFQGGGYNSCPLSVLTSNPTSITMMEPGCAQLNVGLYEHLGRALGGGDWYASTGQFASDNGGHNPQFADTSAYFGAESITNLIRIVQNSGSYAVHDTSPVPTPYEGDAVISPSATAVLLRIGGGGGTHLGFSLRELVPDTNGSTLLHETARYCVSGGKPAMSFDERWIVYHHYMARTDAEAQELGFTGASDPGFAPYAESGTANVYLLDMLTGATKRITNMGPGQYALFPHFRSDGWIYMNIRSVGSSTEYFGASDAALLAE